MTDEKKRILQERMAELHKKYCNKLPEKYQEIEVCWNDYKTDLNNPEYSELFYRLIHTLKGTASTFGFNTQANICFEIQMLLMAAMEKQSILTDDSVIQIQKHLDELKSNISSPAEDISD